ncbi:MAG TPA: PAS domain-containing sensor histidine kinase [Gammaproteobacteria bacterium]|nr:PAS domain-containing sensor histidine kinase [Gammaproteobacteria bacterium]
MQSCGRIRNPVVDAMAAEAEDSRLRRLLDALPGGVVVLNGDGCVSDINTTGRAWFGELTEQLWYSVVARLFEPTADASGDVVLKNGRQLAVTTCPMAGQAGQILLFQDVTTSRMQQQQLSRASRLQAMGETAAHLAHQIRTPLATALLYLSHLDSGTEHARLITEKIRGRLRHLESLIEDMLIFARGGSQVTEKLNVSELLQATVVNQQSLYKKQQIVLQLQPIDEALVIRGNRDALAGVIDNLLVNALQILTESGTPAAQVVVSARCDLQEVCIHVHDNGPGVADDECSRIFEPFYTTRSQGTGLGLAVVQLVMQAHHGLVKLVPVATGACFELRLPLLPESVASTTAAVVDVEDKVMAVENEVLVMGNEES